MERRRRKGGREGRRRGGTYPLGPKKPTHSPRLICIVSSFTATLPTKAKREEVIEERENGGRGERKGRQGVGKRKRRLERRRWKEVVEITSSESLAECYGFDHGVLGLKGHLLLLLHLLTHFLEAFTRIHLLLLLLLSSIFSVRTRALQDEITDGKRKWKEKGGRSGTMKQKHGCFFSPGPIGRTYKRREERMGVEERKEGGRRKEKWRGRRQKGKEEEGDGGGGKVRRERYEL